MATAKEKAPNKVDATALDFDFLFNGGSDEYSYGSGSVQVFATPKKDKASKVPEEPADKYTEKWYLWYYTYGVGGQAEKKVKLMDAYISQQESCCGFAVLSNLEACDDPKTFKLVAVPAGEKFGAQLKKQKYKYLSAYVPELGEYENVAKFLEAAGFKAGTKVKSNHGRYMNVRWEFQPENK